MISGDNRILVDSMQLKRIEEQPIQTKETLLVFDNLEAGILRIYEPTGGPVTIQQLYSRYSPIRNAVLIAEAIINSNWRDEGVYIHSVFCEYGHESPIQPMLEQIIHFANLYDCYQAIGMSELTYNKCLPYAKETLADFKKVNRSYEYQLDQ